MTSACHTGFREGQGGFGYVMFRLWLQQTGSQYMQQDRTCGQYE